MIFFKTKPDIEGFDTETYKGGLLIICNSKSCFEFDKTKPYELIEWLFYNSTDLNFFYNLKFDMSVILKPYLTIDNSAEIREKKVITIGKFEVSFIDKKFFTIKNLSTRNNRYKQKRFFDVAQFYTYKGQIMSLDNASKQELGDNKNNIELGLDRQKIGSELGYYEKHKELIKEYCIKDSDLTRRLSIKRVEIFGQLFNGLYPKNYYSSASLSKAYLELNHKEEKFQYAKLILSAGRMKKDLFNYTVYCYHGGIFYDKVFGKIEHVNELDINSAYPDKIANLKSIIDCKFDYVTKFTDADYGFYKVKMKFSEIPYPFRNYMGNILYPQTPDLVENFLTIPEIKYLLKHNIPIKIIDGYIIKTKGKLAFDDFTDLYTKRLQYKEQKNESMQWALKLIMNATYGCLAQSKHGLTSWTNFIYASYITALTRIQLLEMNEILENNKCKVISFRTDALMYAGDYRYSSEKLGDFKQEFENGTLYNYMSGFSILNLNGKITLSKRGFSNMTADDLLNATGNELKSMDNPRPLGMTQGIIQHRINDIGDFEAQEKTMNLHSLLIKYFIDIDKLTFENFNNNEITPEQIITNNNPIPYKISTDKYLDWITRNKKLIYYMEKSKNKVNENSEITVKAQ